MYRVPSTAFLALLLIVVFFVVAHAQRGGQTAPARPAQPAARPAQPAARPAQPAARPAQPAARPAQPATRSAQPATRPAQPAANPVPTRPIQPANTVPARSTPSVNTAPPVAEPPKIIEVVTAPGIVRECAGAVQRGFQGEPIFLPPPADGSFSLGWWILKFIVGSIIEGVVMWFLKNVWVAFFGRK
ncbi:MAG: hypothetical protein FWE95_06360 [Planctomycetaceae bacterium]|nr:hypothetical protein [Planctomycetaceae bacterium]